MLKEVFEHLVSTAESELGCGCVKGYPDWARPAVSPPVAALEITTWGPVPPTRIGQKQARQSASFRLWVFARHEPELAALLDSLAAWAVGGEAPVIDGHRVEVTWLEGQRHGNESGSQQEAHGFWAPIVVSW